MSKHTFCSAVSSDLHLINVLEDLSDCNNNLDMLYIKNNMNLKKEKF